MPLKHLKTSKQDSPESTSSLLLPELSELDKPGAFHYAIEVSAKPEPPTTILVRNYDTKHHFSFHPPKSPPLCKRLPPQPSPPGGRVSPVPHQTPH